MDERNWQKVKEIFLAALEKDAGSRLDFLDEICGDDRGLRAEVESLLAAHTEVDDFIEEPVFVAGEIFAAEAGSRKKHFGNYEIIRELGAGGMGAVFLAERSDGEYEQQVAIKIIRQAIAERELINRFKRERQILASLNHPNIAKLLDGGVSDDGQPFLAMEYVEGEAITKFIERENPNLETRLKLFLKVCAAVAYAHRNLIVHRDLKPGNIQVTADGEPKLLDFGLAKLLDEHLSNDTAGTQTAFHALTPAYASPEQLKNEAITTASDIYSLGIIFYELLTGRRPFYFEGKNLQEIIGTVTQAEPPLPSFVREGETGRRGDREKGRQGEGETGRRGDQSSFDDPTPPLQLPFSSAQIKGDLDNIALMALRKEPARRYQSVEALAEDIERYLKGLPVTARPNTFKYRASKFIRRHKIGVLAASLILLSLIGGTIFIARQARNARREKDKAEVVNSFLQNLLGAANPEMNLSRSNGHDTTVKELLDTAATRLENGDLGNQPEVRAELLKIIGLSYLTQGQYDAAAKNLDAAIEAQKGLYGEDSPETLQTLVLIADLWINRGNYTEAGKFYRQRISILRAGQAKSSGETDSFFTALYDFALLRRAQGDSKEAETLIREALSLRTKTSSEMKSSIGIAESVLALTLADQGNFDEAEDMVRTKLSGLQGQNNTETSEYCGVLTMYASILTEKGANDEAEKNLIEAESIYRKLYTEKYLPLGDNLRIQAQTLYAQNKFNEAEAKITECLEIYQQVTSTQYANYANALVIRGLILNKTNRAAEAEKILREAVKIRTDNLPNEHFWVALAKGALGENLTVQKRFSEAEPLLSESYESLKISQGENNPRTKLALQRLSGFYQAQKQ